MIATALRTLRYKLLAVLLALSIPMPVNSQQALATESELDEDYVELPNEPTTGNPFRKITDFLKITNPTNKDSDPLVVNGSINILGKVVAPASFARLSWEPQDTFESLAAPTPVLVLNGANPGPTLCLTGAVHGDEINGIEIIRRVFFDLDPKEISGVIVGVPIVNQMGFRRASRYLPDRRDLNRYFPGDPTGSSASRIAHTFFNDIIRHCDALVDLHTGSFHRTNIPQLRADMRNEKVTQLVHGFGGIIVIHNEGAKGSLRRAAVESGIAAVTLEAGEPMHIQNEVVKDGVERIRSLLSNMGIYKRSFYWSNAEPVYTNSRWIRSEQGGLLLSDITVGDKITKGQTLGKVVDPINNREYTITSPYDGQVIGMALNQVVMPGYAAYHIGLQATEKSLETGATDQTSDNNQAGGNHNNELDSPNIH